MLKEFRWIAQDKDGAICKFRNKPVVEPNSPRWSRTSGCFNLIQRGNIAVTVNNWTTSVIDRETHDYEILNGVLLGKEKSTRNKYADVLIESANDTTKVLQCRLLGEEHWRNCSANDPRFEYRIKPKVLKYRNYLTTEDTVGVASEMKPIRFKRWLGEWQEVEI